jgi:hypothetical protein
MPAKKKIATETETSIMAYKAFDNDLSCRGFQYEVGKTYEHKGGVRICDTGFHACTDPLDVLNYYDITSSRFARVTMGGAISKKADGDSKIAAGKITIEAELKLPEFIKAAIQWVADACKADDKTEITSGHSATNASSGDSAKNASSGHSATNASSGDYATNASSGDYATNASSGHSAKNASSGHSAKNASSGDYATNASSGHSATNASSGDYATNASSGHSAKNASSGDYAWNEATGEHSVIAGAGRDTKAKGANGVWISLAEYARVGSDWRCVGFASGQAGYDGVPADTWLIAKGGKLVAA